jgi:hypothetical protein
LCAPHCHKHQRGRQGIEQPALGHQHGKEEILPLRFGLHDVRRSGLHDGPRPESAGEKKGGQGESAAPAPKSSSRRGRPEQSCPSQSLVNRDPNDAQHSIPEVHARVVGEGRAGKKGVVRPERAAVGPADDQIEMQGRVTQVVRRKNLQLVALFVDDPDKRAEGSNGKNNEHGCVGPSDFLPRCGGAPCGHDSRRGAEGEGNPCAAQLEASGQRGQASCRDRGDRGEDQSAAKNTPTGHGSPLRGGRWRGSASIAPANSGARKTMQSSTPERTGKRSSS